jgi:hypothetical protein
MNPHHDRLARMRQQLRPQKLLNKSFYRFAFSFVAVVAGVLLFILVLGASNGVQ